MTIINNFGPEPIHTSFWPKPGPTRAFDWSATFYNLYDGAPDAGPQLIGYGSTEREAILDLLEQYDNDILDSLPASFPGFGATQCAKDISEYGAEG